MSQRGRIAGEAGGVMAAEVASTLVRYVGSVFMTRALGLAWFGSVTLALTITSLLTTAAMVGTAPGALPFLARARRSGDPAGVRAVVRSTWVLVGCAGLLIGCATLGLAPWFAGEVFGKAELGPLLRATSVLISVAALCTATTGLIQGFLGVRRQAVIDRIVVPGTTACGMWLSWQFEWGLPGVIAASIAGPLLGLAAAVVVVARLAPGVLSSRQDSAPLVVAPLLRDSWPLMGVSMSSFVLMWMDVLFVGALRASEEVGVYGACARLAPAVMLVHNAAGPVFLARLSDGLAHGDWPRIRHLYRVTGQWSLWSGATFAAVLVVWGRELLAIFGAEFVAGAGALTLLALARAASAAAGMCGRMLSIGGRARLNLVNVLLMIGINAALDLLWIPRWGAEGAAAATLVSIAAVNLLQTVQVWTHYRVHPFSRASALGLVLVPALAWAASTWHAGPQGLLGHAAWLVPLTLFLLACGVAYVSLAASDEDRAFVLDLLRRDPR